MKFYQTRAIGKPTQLVLRCLFWSYHNYYNILVDRFKTNTSTNIWSFLSSRRGYLVDGVLCVPHPPAAVFQGRLLDSQDGASRAKRVPIVPIPNDTYSESPRRDASKVDLFGTGTIPTTVFQLLLWRYRAGKIG